MEEEEEEVEGEKEEEDQINSVRGERKRWKDGLGGAVYTSK